MKTTSVKLGLSLLVILIVALAAYLWYRNASSAEQRLADTAKRSQYVFGQYINADYGSAKGAMLDHILLLDRLSAGSSNPSRNTYAADAMAWFVRLAKLEERNDGSGRGEYMGEACSRCEQLGKADCSEANLSQQIDRMDTIARSHLTVGPNNFDGR
jgi:hypothetical protein